MNPVPFGTWLFLGFALSISLPTQGADGAVIEGKVTLAKPGKVETPGPLRYQGQTIQPGKPEATTAVVYLEGMFAGAKTNRDTVQLGQKNLQFTAGLLPVQKGMRVEFPNFDDGYHNVFSYSKTKRFDLGRYRKDEKPAVQVFEEPGVVKLYCEIHQHMHSTILVLDTPYFTKTETNGQYRLENLPAGKYTVKAWLDEKNVIEKPVELEAGKTVHIDFDRK